MNFVLGGIIFVSSLAFVGEGAYNVRTVFNGYSFWPFLLARDGAVR